MVIDPNRIVEQQLALLQKVSDQGLLTLDETTQLATLVKVRILLRAKGATEEQVDPYTELSADELKQLLPHLG